jgi:uncharacterized membrane protein
MGYSWLKAFHLAAALAWIGGLLLQSVVVAAASHSAPRGADAGLLPAVRSWDRRVTSPALILVWALGLWAAVAGGWFASGWLHAKLVLVLLLSGLHGAQVGVLRRVAASGEPAPAAFRWTPPVVLLAATAIALLVVTKPF